MTAAADRAPATPRVRGLSCPSCGGVLDAAVGLRVVPCPFCGKTLLAAGALGTERLAVMPEVDAARAATVARNWLGSGWNKDPGLRREAMTRESFLCFIPFFRVRADVVGHALGTEQRTRTVGSGKNRRTETYEVDVEKQVKQSFDRTSAAVNVGEWGVQQVNLAGDRLVPFDPEGCSRLGMIFPPTGSQPEMVERTLASFRDEADPAKGLKRVRLKFLATLRERVALVFYPLWIVRYEFRGRSYQVAVDAQDGSLAYGKAPGNDLYRAAVMVGSQAAAGFVFTTILQLLLDSSDNGCGPLVFAGLAAGAILAWGWRRFRYGGVVIEGTGAVEEKRGASVSEQMKKLGDRFGVKT